jgi:hypothetical protein
VFGINEGLWDGPDTRGPTDEEVAAALSTEGVVVCSKCGGLWKHRMLNDKEKFPKGARVLVMISLQKAHDGTWHYPEGCERPSQGRVN